MGAKTDLAPKLYKLINFKIKTPQCSENSKDFSNKLSQFNVYFIKYKYLHFKAPCFSFYINACSVWLLGNEYCYCKILHPQCCYKQFTAIYITNIISLTLIDKFEIDSSKLKFNLDWNALEDTSPNISFKSSIYTWTIFHSNVIFRLNDSLPFQDVISNSAHFLKF